MKRHVFAIIVFLSAAGNLSAQENWGGGVDDELIHFGFTFQYVNSEFKVLKKSGWRSPFYSEVEGGYVTDSLYSISSLGTPGFGLGFVTNVRLGDNADLRLTPNLVFSDRIVNFEYVSVTGAQTLVEKKVQSTLIDFPLGIKLKSDRRKNFRAYVLAGGKYSLDIVSKKKLDDEELIITEKLLKTRKGFLSYEAGVGFDLYFEYFKLSPEIKFSQSLNDVMKRENHPYSSPIDKLFLRNIQLSLFFE